MLDCQVAMLEDALARYSVSGKIPGRLGTRHPSITPFQQFRAADDYFVMGAGNESVWLRFCDALAMPQLKDDKRFATNAYRTANHPELEAILARTFATQPRDHWLQILTDASVPCAPIANVEEVSRDPHLAARNMILRAEHSSFDGLIVPGSPLKSAGDKISPRPARPGWARTPIRCWRACWGTILRVYRNSESGVSYRVRHLRPLRVTRAAIT
jgi:CoA:oxalate CoA-transferase